MESVQGPFRVGILGCANIAKKNCRAARLAGCEVAAVASRTREKAEAFVDEVLPAVADGSDDNGPLIFSGEDAYDKLLNYDGIDAVYIPLPTKMHDQYVEKALSASKHVLLEKPVASSSSSYRKMLNSASASNQCKLLMDGTMFVHHPRTKQFVTSIHNPNRVNFSFSFDGGDDFFRDNIRVKKDGDFMGCIGDLGWYCVRMGLLVFTGCNSEQLNEIVTAVHVVRYQLNGEGVPFDADCMVHFSQNRVLSFHCSFIHPFNQTVRITGTGSEYTATMTDAILPRQGDVVTYSMVKQNLIQYDEITTEKTDVVRVNNSQGVQELCMWNNFVKWAREIEQSSTSKPSSSLTENGKFWNEDSAEAKEANSVASYSLHTQIVLDALMQSIKLGGTKVQLCPNTTYVV